MSDSINNNDIQEFVVLDEREIAVDLLTAAVDGCLVTVREILDTFPHLVHAYCRQSGETALHLAAQEGHADMLKALIDDYGADVNAKAKNGITAVIYAAHFGEVRMIDYLIGRNADLTVRFMGGTPLHIAAAAGQHSAVERLLRAGVDGPPA